jgi:hypothetical protein
VPSDNGALPTPQRRPEMDKGFRRLLNRLLKNFAADSRQRELSFPANLSSADRRAGAVCLFVGAYVVHCRTCCGVA